MEAQINSVAKGWDLTHTTRLVWVNGQYDLWRPTSVSSDVRPGGQLQSTPKASVYVISQSIHCSDLIACSGQSNQDVQAVMHAEIAHIKAWVGEFPKRA